MIILTQRRNLLWLLFDFTFNLRHVFHLDFPEELGSHELDIILEEKAPELILCCIAVAPIFII